MNKSLFYIVVVAAIGGFLFGFDSGVISAPIELDRIYTNEFITEWDKAQVEADAAAYDWQSVAANYEAG